MKKKNTSPIRRLITGGFVSLFACATPAAFAALEWDGGVTDAAGGGSGTWDQIPTATNWWDGADNVVWTSGGDANFSGTAGLVNLDAGGVTAHNLTFNTTGYVISTGGPLTLNGATPTVTNGASIISTIDAQITGNDGLTKAGDGTLKLNGPNNYGGDTNLSAGTLVLGSTSAISSGTLTIASGTTLDSSVVDLVNAGNNPQTWNASFTFTGTENLDLGSGTITPTSGTTTITVSAKTLSLSGNITVLSGSRAISKNGLGTLSLKGNNFLNPAADGGGGAITVTGGVSDAVRSTLEVSAGLTTNRGSNGNRSYGALTIGSGVSGYNTVKLNGGRLEVGSVQLGNDSVGYNKLEVSTPGSSAAPSLRTGTNSGQYLIGVNSTNNSMTISNGAYCNLGTGGGTDVKTIGQNVGANNNSVTVTGAGSTWIANGGGSDLKVGQDGNFNTLQVLAGGLVTSRRFLVGAGAGSDNYAVIDASTANTNVDTNTVFTVGTSGDRNSWTVKNGGTSNCSGTSGTRAFNMGANVGADDNFILVTGVGSSQTISNSAAQFVVGGTLAADGGSGNHIDVQDGANATLTNLLLRGTNSSLNIGNGSSNIAKATVGYSSAAQAQCVNLSVASAKVTFDKGRMTAQKNDVLVTGPGSVQLVGPGYIDTAFTNSISSVISGTGSLTKENSGTLALTAINTYTGDTFVDAGILQLDDNAGLKFVVTDAASNKVSGNLGSFALINGDFTIDTSAVTVASGSWVLVDTAIEESFGATFTVVGFTESSDVHTKVDGAKTWTFSEATGTLTLVTAGGTPYGTWMSGFSGIAVADQDPEDDPDGDGESNLEEFAFNGTPNDAGGGGKFHWILQDNTDGDILKELTFTCAMRRSATGFAANGNNAQASASGIDGIDYVIEADTDLLGTWNSSVSYIGKSDTPPPGSGLPNLSGEDWEYRTFSAFNNLGGRGFMRGRVSVAP